jgi:glutamate/tyrosine decarboxylase-like PLP-dependent enzyme
LIQDISMTPLQARMFAELAEKSALEQGKQASYEYLDSLRAKEVFPCTNAINALAEFDEQLPDSATSAVQVVQLLHRVGSPATVAQNGGRYFGFVNGNALPVTTAVSWLSTIWDQNAALYVMSPISAKLESICQQWLVELFNLPKQTVAGFVSGTSIATFSGLAAARYRLLEKMGWDVNRQGIFGAPPLRVILGRQSHGTVIKALAMLGFGSDSLEWVECDEQGRMCVEQLPPLDDTCIVILQAGNVNSGAFDDFKSLCGKANQVGAWVHIDGAFGLWAGASERFTHLTQGIHLAQSWSVDGHKTLNTPYDSGVILCADPQALSNALQQQGSYIQHSTTRDGMLYTPEMSRRARATELWAAMKYLGRSGMAELVEQLHDNARLFASLITLQGFKVLNDVVFVACGDDDITQAVLERIQQSGEYWCGGSIWQGKKVIRVSVCSWATSKTDIKKTVACFVSARIPGS